MRRSRMSTRPSHLIFPRGLIALTLLTQGCENPQAPAKPAGASRAAATEMTDSTLRAATPLVIEKPKAEAKVASQVAMAPDPAKAKPAPVKRTPTATSAGPPAMPQVLMSEKHRKSCQVFVGDLLPEMELSDLAGKQRKLSTEYGKKLTVICMFGGKLPSEDQELMDLTTEMADRYGKEQVAVIGVAVGQSSDSAAAHAKKLGVKFPVFTDSNRKAYDVVANDYLPRTYLIDSTGKILWLDLEYSASTRRQISEAIRHVLETK